MELGQPRDQPVVGKRRRDEQSHVGSTRAWQASGDAENLRKPGTHAREEHLARVGQLHRAGVARK